MICDTLVGMSATDAIPEEFLSPYDPKSVEREMYQKWENSGYFDPDQLPDSSGDVYTIIMPPPNASGSLHAGNALFVTLEDVMIRYNRMLGKRALWVPGFDHAGFETQAVYERVLAKEGKSRFDFSREELYQQIYTFAIENKGYVEEQLRKLGASCDWSRALFTLDDRVKEQVYATFEQLDKDGLLYRGLRSVHWCPKHQTGFSDLELEHEERKDPFYYFQYGPFVIGTVRPETKFGDKYLVVHPDDERYSEYAHGQTFEVDWINGPITATIIKDKAADPEQGSGAMTITPWHSTVDWEIAERHDLSSEQIIDERGKLLPIAQEFAGRRAVEARSDIVEKMREKGLLVRVDEEYTHTVPQCYKCGREIEPQLKKQWFIRMQPLAKRAKQAILSGDVSFVTERYKRIALSWLDDIQDWNISRQVVWGIPIPAKICTDCGHGMVAVSSAVSACPECGGSVEEDTDSFDTWFSSGQWPFIALGYPHGRYYRDGYPTAVMETGHDILFFWVLRMLMLGLYRTGTVPFRDIYLHGLIRDGKGQKMSKSKGNVVDPIAVGEEYGVDALRMAFLVGNAPGENMNFSLEKIGAYKKFANKLWNIARFVLAETQGYDPKAPFLPEDAAHVRACEAMLSDVTSAMDQYAYHLASEQLYQYIWHTFADTIIEESKEALQGDDSAARGSKQRMLLAIYLQCLRALHPFMPFVTEKIWQYMPKGESKQEELLLVERWPLVRVPFWKKLFSS